MPVYSNPAETFAGASGQAGAASTANPYVQPPPAAVPPPAPAVQTSPGLAFLLGLIPGVGAIYNGQYLKGLVHAGIFGVLVTLASHGNGEPLMGMIVAAFYFYMPFEAYHTAKKRQMGMRVDEWSSLLPRSRYADRAPIGPIVLILIGVLFLLDSLHMIDFEQVGRFWPVILIAVGVYLLYSRMTRHAELPPGSQSSSQPGSAPHNTVVGGR